MSFPEVGYRIGQKLQTKAEQCAFRSAHRVAAPDLAKPARPFVSFDPPLEAARYVAAADRLLAGRLQVFDIEYVYGDLPQWNRDPKSGTQAPLVFGKSLDYRREEIVGDIKYLWEINRHLELVTVAQAFRLTGRAEYLDGLRGLLESWEAQCPYPLGVNWASALEVAIRVINWSAVWHLIGGLQSPLFRGKAEAELRDRWLVSIYRHLHFIQGNFSRYSSANNHLIGEAAGLYIGCTTWPFWPATRRWCARARRELIRETLGQCAADGVNREQSTWYQQFVLSFLLLAALAGRANGDDFPVEYWQRIERMLEFIAALLDAGGNMPMIGDADDGYVVRLSQEPEFSVYRSLLATGAVVFTRADFKAKAGVFDDQTYWLLGDSGERKWRALGTEPSNGPVRRAFQEGGYYILGGGFDTPAEIRICADAGPLGYLSIAAHGHADALAFTLSIGGEEFLIDPGTYAYHTGHRWRDYFRGTAAHNTVRVDGENQSVIGGNFMWTHHARTALKLWRSEEGGDRLVAAHDGYRRLSDPVWHERELVFDRQTRCLEVSDRFECSGKHEVECFWHFAEDVEVKMDVGGSVLAKKGGHAIRLVSYYPWQMTAAVYRGDEALPAGWVSRRFGVKRLATTVVWRCDISGTTRLTARLECRVAREPSAP